ncbi:MAG: fibronectin type III domain-containing protein [Oscillospiraceae bacterium]|nr:fibronectin type III domain-containing protein [Oscillospiraceae bacterium]
MSEPKLISPLLDGFVMGNPMSSHDGVRCCPAIKEKSENKYIVKIISIPASQVQLDALLLTGAYKDPADAMDYFKEVTDGVVKEAEILGKLARLEGFLPYDSWQIDPMEEGKLGYQVYLISSYKRSLEKYMRRNVMTHLESINLGLDLCHALAICRKAGYLYVDLKPGNIYISRDKEYRIGDLGFVELDSLAYTSLPGKYMSAYSAPETKDAMRTLNETADTYAVGMILYQIYNDGTLPEPTKEPTDSFPNPVNADYELSEIIMKAISPDPKDRWKDPMEMGQALVAYMQRNSVNNTPVTPKLPVNTDGVALEDAPKPAEKQPEELAFMEKMVSDDTAPSEQDAEGMEETQVTEETTSILSEAEELIRREVPETVVVPEEVPLPEPEPIVVESPEPTSEELPIEEPPAEVFSVPELQIPVTEPDEEDESLFTLDMDALEEDGDAPEEEPEEEIPAKPVKRKHHRKRRRFGHGWLAPVVTLLLLALLGFGGIHYYQNYYLQTIDGLTVDGSQNTLTVTVDTAVDQTLLNVICTDTYGNSERKALENGQAVFTNLLPNSQYKITLEISGFHKLIGKTTDMFNTDSQTNVVSFTGSIGPEDGSAILSLTVDGSEPKEWTLTYSTEEEEPKTETFSGHNVTIKGLTVGKTYTFQLSCEEDTQLIGATTLEYTAARIVMADNVHVTAINEGNMTIRWDSPEDVVVESWIVRCYDNNGNEQTQEVTSNAATFTGIDKQQSYTIEVTAFGMTQPTRASITANPITITALKVDESSPDQLTVSWEFDGEAPEGGWLLMYGFAGSDKQSVMKCEEPTAVISPRVPSATYTFTLQAADNTSVFGGEQSYTSPTPEIFSDNDLALSADSITGHLLKTPDGEWSFESVGKESFSDTFSSGDKLSLVLQSSIGFYLHEREMSVLYVFRNGNGSVVPDLVSTDTINWKDLWYDGDYHYGELDIPTAPTEPGKYSLSLYFNNAAVIYITFTVK